MSRPNIPVTLGEQRTVDFKLQIETIAETVEVIGQSSIIDSSRAGTADNISSQAVQSLPTITRNIVDIARTSPYFNPAGLNEDPLALSVAGRNNRYNNLQIDGAVNNDVFGLAPSGTPGGTTEAQPISLDAIQELQLVVSPYDVRQGGFSGGGINAITQERHERAQGHGVLLRPQPGLGRRGPERHEGRAVQGQAVRRQRRRADRAEQGVLLRQRRLDPQGQPLGLVGRRQRPAVRTRGGNRSASSTSCAPGTATTRAAPKSSSARSTATSSSSAATSTSTRATSSPSGTTISNAQNDIGRPTTALYYMPDKFYRIKNKTNSTVAPVEQHVGHGGQRAALHLPAHPRPPRRGQPDEERPFPFIQVDLSAGQVRAGRENFSTANELDQDVYELTDDFTLLRGKHTLTFGTHNEFFKFRNLFIRDSFGNYRFDSLDLFEQGLAQSYDYSFSLTGDPQQAAQVPRAAVRVLRRRSVACGHRT